jgi:hypothetical protein
VTANSKITAAFDALPADTGLNVVTTGIRMQGTNPLMERWK